MFGHFTLVFLQMTSKKYTKFLNARAELLFCSLDILFRLALVAVAVVFLLKVPSVLFHSLIILLTSTLFPNFQVFISLRGLIVSLERDVYDELLIVSVDDIRVNTFVFTVY